MSADPNIERMGLVFGVQAHTARLIQKLAAMLADGVKTLDDEQTLLLCIEALAERVGLVADLQAQACGLPAVRGGVSEWFQPGMQRQPEMPG